MPMPHWKYRPYPTVDLPDRTWPNTVVEHAPTWCSTDLRDGNQALVKPMDAARKQRMFDLLVQIGVKEIEVGFPAASKTDFDFVRRLIEEELVPADTTIAVLTQARPELIEETFRAIEGAPRAIVHLYNSTSTTQRRVVFRLDEAGIVDLAVRATELCRQLASQATGEIVFQYSPESFHGTELEFALEICEAVTAAWQPTAEAPMIVNLPTTVEAFPPNVYADRMEWFGRHVTQRDRVVLSVHPHNDRGTAVATAELGLMAGARARRGDAVRKRRANRQRRPRHDRAQPAHAGRRPAARPVADSTRRSASSRSATSCRSTRGTRGSGSSSTRRSRGRTRMRSRRACTHSSAPRRGVGRPVPPDRPGRSRPKLRGDHPRQLAVGQGRRRVPDGVRAPPSSCRAACRSTSRRRCRRSPTRAATS